LISELEVLVGQAKDAGISVTDYELKLSKIKIDYSVQFNKLDRTAKEYLERGLYQDTKEVSLEVLEASQEIENTTKTLINELKEKVAEKEKVEVTPEPTKEPSLLEKVDLRIVGVSIGVLLLVVVVAVGLRRFARRRKFDELK
jgi:hypothetical protein